MKNVNCKHCDKYGKCSKKPKKFFIYPDCIESRTHGICEIADRYVRQNKARPRYPLNQHLKDGSIGESSDCGSSLHRRFFRVIGCIHPQCKNFWCHPPFPIPEPKSRPK